MAIYCDACEHELGKGRSDCCKADVWKELRAHSIRDICKDCGKDCEVIEDAKELEEKVDVERLRQEFGDEIRKQELNKEEIHLLITYLTGDLLAND